MYRLCVLHFLIVYMIWVALQKFNVDYREAFHPGALGRFMVQRRFPSIASLFTVVFSTMLQPQCLSSNRLD